MQVSTAVCTGPLVAVCPCTFRLPTTLEITPYFFFCFGSEYMFTLDTTFV
eukprot:m.383462 g.383462  ORF g.383462 m.383462 type:complete len:50 (+) comp128031_c0_seq1:173-322(+)